jgi:hypothetical protein
MLLSTYHLCTERSIIKGKIGGRIYIAFNGGIRHRRNKSFMRLNSTISTSESLIVCCIHHYNKWRNFSK